MESATQVQILNEAAYTNVFIKGVNSPVLPSPIDK